MLEMDCLVFFFLFISMRVLTYLYSNQNTYAYHKLKLLCTRILSSQLNFRDDPKNIQNYVLNMPPAITIKIYWHSTNTNEQ